MKKWLIVAAMGCLHPAMAQRLTQYVDPFIGTAGHGHTFPGPMVPFGMVQLSPDNGTQGWDWCSGYHYSDSVLAGFSHTHLSGTGIGDLCDISIMPMANARPDTGKYRSRYSHDREKARPGYYQVLLEDSKINAELTASQYTGMHRYTFPQGVQRSVKLDLGFAINWDKAVETVITQQNATTVVGYRKSTGWSKNQVVYFAISTSEPMMGFTGFSGKQKVDGKTIGGADALAFLEFGAATEKPLLLKVGLSSASTAGALASIATVPGWNFDEVAREAEAQWEKALQVMQISSSNPEVLRTFYTALYHTYQAPVQYSDPLGQYKAVDSKTMHSNSPVYTVHSLWDTFRGANPLLTITQPQLVPQLIQSYLSFYRQSGLLPVWDLQFFETNTMTGYHAVPVIADAILKGIKGFDVKEAYAAMKASSMQNVRATDAYRQYGYVPQDKHGWSVTMTLEYAYDDWCIAQVANKLGYKADYETYMKRAASYRSLFDVESGFFRAKNSNGAWVPGWDPYYSEHGFDGQYIEGTAWQHTFFVPHAVDDYARLLGGKDKLITLLDSLFTTTSAMKGDNVSSDISGLIGQYAHGNEPSHHIIYMYTWLGAPQKAAQRIRQVMTTLYSDKPDGLSGNEDCGQMSAWYIWSALGFYPMNPASGQYVFGLPAVDAATIQLPGGKAFSIAVKGQRTDKAYITRATLNGKAIAVRSISHQQIQAGGKLELYLGE